MLDKIVVCGAGGFVGGQLVKYLVDRGFHGVRAVASPRRRTDFAGAENVQADLQNPDECRRVTEGASWIFNLAARVGGIDYISKHKASCMLSARINMNLLECARECAATRYFFSSSSCVYPEGVLLREEDAYPANPTDGYGWEKLFSERVCLSFQEEYGVPVSIARYHGLYGPEDVREEDKDHVIAALCRKVAEAKLSGRHEISIWGDGNQTRSFLYIDDCLEGTVLMTMNGIVGPVNMANSQCVSINSLVSELEEIAAVKLERFYSPSASTGRVNKCSDNTLIRSSMSWEPMTPLKVGLARTYRACWARLITGAYNLKELSPL